MAPGKWLRGDVLIFTKLQLICMSEYQLMFLRWLAAVRDWPGIDHRFHWPDHALFGLSSEEASEQAAQAYREFIR